jgi:hypothetical protein
MNVGFLTEIYAAANRQIANSMLDSSKNSNATKNSRQKFKNNSKANKSA